MKLQEKSSFFTAVVAGLIGGVVSAAIIVGMFLLLKPPVTNKSAGVSISQTPTIDKLDTMTCPRGLSLVTQIRGQEDHFSRVNLEPAAIDPALRRFGSFDDLYKGLPRALAVRNFDEVGVDKLLIQNFNMPVGVVSGSLLLRVKSAAKGADNDYLRLVSSVPSINQAGVERLVSFSASFQDSSIETTLLGPSTTNTDEESTEKRELERIIVIPLQAFRANGPDAANDVMAYFKEVQSLDANTPYLLTLGVYDDTAVDVAALVLCVEPSEARGVTFVEHSDKRSGPDVSVLSCALDDTQSTCGPYTGDTACTQALPLACYKDGSGIKPDNLAKAQVNDANFVGGEVRATSPIAGSSFATIGAADSHCASEFGTGWRVLTYQEGGGGVVISRSQIKPKTRLWIDIRDQPRARCWDRPQ